MSDPAETGVSRWRQAWPDALAFAGGLAVAWFAQWETTDLVWSLWLSSFTVGYAMIVWSLFGSTIGRWLSGDTSGMMLGVVGGLFLLAFFTVHFGMFHYVHSVFLYAFFPVGATGSGLDVQHQYGEIVARYWYFVPMAALAERKAFRRSPPVPEISGDSSPAVGAGVPDGGGGKLMQPYVNVVRLHLLIFFFAFAHVAHLDNFLVYAVVYAVYFFPWRLLSRGKPGEEAFGRTGL